MSLNPVFTENGQIILNYTFLLFKNIHILTSVRILKIYSIMEG